MSQTQLGADDYRAIFDASPGNYLLLDRDFTIVGVNQGYLTATMTKREDIVGQGLFDIFPDNPDDPLADGVRKLRASLQRVLSDKRPDRMPVQHYDIRRPDAEGGGFEERYWSPLNSPILDEHGDVRYIIHWVEDVTEFVRLKRQMSERSIWNEELSARAAKIEAEVYLRGEAVEAQRRLSETARHYQFLADLVPQLIWIADASGSPEHYNQRWVEFTHQDRDLLLQHGWQQLVHPDDLAQTQKLWRETIRTRADRFQMQHRLRRHDGTYRWMLTTALPYRDAEGRVLKWFGSATDIHDKVMADERLQHAQRLQAAGQLAGGVAHEVNNMMTIVIGCGDFVLQALGSEHPQRGDVQEMMKAATRASDVTRQLLAYSRQQVFRVSVLNLNDIVNELVPALNRLAGSDRHLAVRHIPGEVWARADRGQIEQVLINLVANSRDATGTDGLISIETGWADFDREQLCQLSGEDIPAGRFARIAVRDNGKGMPPEVAARVFEPFFTTKPIGQGTGLGLSMVYGIAKQSGGFAEVMSTEGEGTLVAVYLPAVLPELPVEPVLSGKVRGAGEQILVVEDDPQVRAIARRALQEAGYAVYEAITGLAASNFLTSHPGLIDVVVSDVVMPGVNGRELADQLRVTHPDLPILFMSGYPGTDIERRGLKIDQTTFIEKPFTPDALVAAVSGAIADRSGSRLQG
ncbi:MAG TPA: PAS domain-containing protein [Gemmatimonadales bacterium]|nr:PAS domain-containing protein [Gemmatimonadales bacterium]